MNISSVFHPTVITTSLVSIALFGSWFTFWLKTNLARTERERAYVCTLMSSSVTSISSLPLVFTLISNGGNMTEILAYRTWTVVITTFFMTFLVMDLCIGVMFYRNKIELLTGWIHHITYLGTLTWAIYQQYTSVFVMMCCLELPTFILALGSVRSQLRRDYLFALSFLCTRIVFHLFSIYCAWKMKPLGPVMLALSAFFPVHCFWFYGFIKQQIRLRSKNAMTSTHTPIVTMKQIPIKPVVQTASVKSVKTSIRKKVHSSKYLSPSFHQSPPVSVH